jgi:metallo-beta-lactamase family protein
MLNVRFLGAAREVTGSMHLVETPQGKILIDCGFHQGRRDESRRRNANLPKEALGADAVILTHAHIDHSGSLPTLVKGGFGGAIWSTTATRDLCSYLLRDSARIQESDAKWLNRKFGDDPGWTPIEPIYDENDAIHALSRFAGVSYSLPFSPLPGITARFLDAGHILGSAQVVLDLPGGKRIVFSGDLGRRGLPILRDPELPGRADYLVMESTYGNRAHGSLHQMHDDLERVIKDVCEKKGKLIIPAFAVGRTQEIVYALNQLHHAGRIPEIPVFVDSPLSVHATEVFKLHPECYDEETRAFVEHNGDPFTFKSLRYLESREESMQLNDMKGPFIVVSASGMCEAGRVLHHLKNAVESENNTILIVGFQAVHTLGRRLVERRPRVKILGVERDLFARVVVMNAFSAHGDKNDLREYAHAAKGARRIFLIHGEPEQQEPLRELLTADGLSVQAPEAGDVAELD